MRAEAPPQPQVHGVLGGRAFFHVRVDPAGWRAVFAQYAGREDELPDWWMLGEIAEPVGVTNRVGQMAMKRWLLIATPHPEWWVQTVEQMANEQGEEKQAPSPTLIVPGR